MESQDESVDFSYARRVLLSQVEDHSSLQESDISSNIPASSTINGEVVCGSTANRDGLEQVDQRPETASTNERVHQFPLQDSHQQTPHSLSLSKPRLGNMSLLNSSIGGDTQPLSPSVYESYANRQEAQHAEGQPIESENDPNPRDSTPLRETSDEIVHIGLPTEFKQSQLDNEHVDDNRIQKEDDLPNQLPETASASPRRDEVQNPIENDTNANHDTEDVRAATTPDASGNPLGHEAETSTSLMAMSQVFQTTQTPTSPVANNLSSDGPSQCPSPSISFHDHDRQSSPRPLLSSPIKVQTPEPTALTAQPQANYVSMKESQARRDIAQLMERSSSTRRIVDVSSDEEFLDEDTYERKRLERLRVEEARKQLFDVTSTDYSPKKGSPNKNLPMTFSPQSSMRRPDPPTPENHVDNQIEEYPDANLTEDETEREDNGEDLFLPEEPPMEENKENINTDLQIPMTAMGISPIHRNHRLPQSSPIRHEQTFMGSNYDAPSPSLSDILEVPASSDDHAFGVRSSQVLAIENSQPSSTPVGSRAMRVLQTSEPHVPLETREFVPQSQPALQHDEERSGSCPPLTTGNDMLESNLPLTASSEPVGYAPAAKRLQPSPLMKRSVSQEPNHDIRNSKLFNTHLHIPEFKLPSPESTAPIAESQVPPTLESNTHQVQRPASAPAPASSSQSRDLADINTVKTHSENNYKGTPEEELATVSLVPLMTPPRRSLTDIASSPTPKGMERSLDFDIDIMTEEDMEFKRAIEGSSPPLPIAKRRRGPDGRAIVEPTEEKVEVKKEKEKENAIDSEPLEGRQTPKIPDSKVDPSPQASIPNSFEIRIPTNNSQLSDVRTSSKRKRVYKDVLVSIPRVPSSSLSDYQATPPKPLESPHESVKSKRAIRSTPKPVVVLGQNSTFTGDSLQASSSKRRGTPRVKAQVQRQTRPRRQLRKSSTMNERSRPQNGRNFDDAPPDMLAPDRVFACFNDQRGGYHPATCLGLANPEERRYKIRFDDGTIDYLDENGISRLELRQGDSVKIDYPREFRQTYVVVGLGDQILDQAGPSRPTEQDIYPKTDIHGNLTVHLLPKSQVPDVSDLSDIPKDQIESISITNIYLARSMWSHFKPRRYHFYRAIAPLGTPATTRQSITPSSRLRSSAVFYRNDDRDASSSPDLLSSSLFSNMVFAISYGNRDPSTRSKISHLVISNGGMILQTGFDELFDQPDLFSAAPGTTQATPKRGKANARTTRYSASKAPAQKPFVLSQYAKRKGFVALLADRHSRSVKYIQALALSIPCVAGRWICDCVAANEILSWDTYLLPAGESAFLGGAVRSRALTPYAAELSKLSKVLNERTKFFDGKRVMFITGRNVDNDYSSNSRRDRSRAVYLFLTHALGAAEVWPVAALDDARSMLARPRAPTFDIIYAGESSDHVAEAFAQLFGPKDSEGIDNGKKGRGRKRKRSSTSFSVTIPSVPTSLTEGDSVMAPNGKTRIIDSEFIVQSLILEKLLEE